MTEPDELLAALQQTATVAERLLELSRWLFEALDSEKPMTANDRATLAPALDRWDADLATLRDGINKPYGSDRLLIGCSMPTLSLTLD